MSSFLFDSTIGMGGSDSRGLIQQPLMDWEVFSIGGSSSKDTRRGASDNESFSSERLRVLHCTGGGTSSLHGRTFCWFPHQGACLNHSGFPLFYF